MTEQNDGLPSKSSEAVSSGLQAIVEFEGDLDDVKKVSGKRSEGQTWEPREQVQVTFTDVIIREMEGNQPEPELTDDKHTIWYNFGKAGAVEASKQMAFARYFMKSAEELWKARKEPEKGWRDLLHERCVMRKKMVPWKVQDRDTGEERTGESGYFVFIEGNETSFDKDAYIDDLFEGESRSTALRKWGQDNKLKRDMTLKEAIKSGQPIGHLELVEDVYVKKETEETAPEEPASNA